MLDNLPLPIAISKGKRHCTQHLLTYFVFFDNLSASIAFVINLTHWHTQSCSRGIKGWEEDNVREVCLQKKVIPRDYGSFDWEETG